MVKRYETRVVKPQLNNLAADPFIIEAAELLRAGELVAFPTETVYGLGADATSTSAVESIFATKRRPADNPVIVHIGEVDAVADVGDASDPRVLLLARHFWPGPLTLVIPAREPVRTAACRGLGTVAVRMPAHPIALAMIRASSLPVAAPSANLSGRPSPTTAQHVLDDLETKIPIILDGGPCDVGIESTVLDLVGPEPRVLRPGAVTQDELSAVLGCSIARAEGAALSRSPGTRYRHYQPSATVILVGQHVSDASVSHLLSRIANAGTLVGYIAETSPTEPTSSVIYLPVGHEAGALARCLYSHLRHLDARGVASIVVRAALADDPVMERVHRAASLVLWTDEEVESFHGDVSRAPSS